MKRSIAVVLVATLLLAGIAAAAVLDNNIWEEQLRDSQASTLVRVDREAKVKGGGRILAQTRTPWSGSRRGGRQRNFNFFGFSAHPR